MKKAIKNNWPYLVTISLLLLYLSPYFFPSQVKILIHDNLDSSVAWFKIISQQQEFWSFQNYEVKEFLGGVPSGLFRNEFSYITILYRFLKPEIAYSTNAILIHFAAYFSALLLLKDYLMKDKPIVLIAVLALSFALIPFRTAALMSLACQPLIIWVFINLYKKKTVLFSIAILGLFPFFSDLFFSNLFFFISIGVCILAVLSFNNSFSKNVLFGLAILFASTFILNWKIIDLIAFDGFQTHRQITRENSPPVLNCFGLIGTSISLALKGQYHALGFPTYLIHFLILGLTFFQSSIDKVKIISLSCLSLFVLAILSQIQDLKGFQNLSKFAPILETLQLRFYTLIPLVQLLTVVLLVNKTSFTKTGHRIFISCMFTLVIFQFTGFFQRDMNGSRYLENTFWSTFLLGDNNKYSTFSKYSKQSFFSGFNKKLASKGTLDPSFFCVGIDPAVLQLNGFSTMDGYFSLIPKSHFLKWGEFLLPELTKSIELSNYFNNWGNRCYTFSNETFRKSSEAQNIQNLDLNFDVYKDLTDKFIISNMQIINVNGIIVQPYLKLDAMDKDFNQVYLYKVK